MSEAPNEGVVPQWTVGDRMGKSLAHSGVSVADMADYLGVHRNTISAYTNSRQAPKRQTLLLWAMRTGVPVEWLETGELAPQSPPTPPRPRADADALARLTEQKRSRTGRSDASRVTNAYPDAA